MERSLKKDAKVTFFYGDKLHIKLQEGKLDDLARFQELSADFSLKCFEEAPRKNF